MAPHNGLNCNASYFQVNIENMNNMKHQNISLIIFGKENTVTLESAWGTLCVFFSPCVIPEHCVYTHPHGRSLGILRGEWPHRHQKWSGTLPTSFTKSPRNWYFLGLLQMTVFGVSYIISWQCLACLCV